MTYSYIAHISKLVNRKVIKYYPYDLKIARKHSFKIYKVKPIRLQKNASNKKCTVALIIIFWEKILKGVYIYVVVLPENCIAFQNRHL